jgi:hypothetical protein
MTLIKEVIESLEIKAMQHADKTHCLNKNTTMPYKLMPTGKK